MKTLLAILMVASSALASGTGGSGTSTLDCVGFTPHPCAYTDNGLHNSGTMPPQGYMTGGNPLTGAGNVWVDPDYGERELRVTDFTNTISGATGTAIREYHTQSASENNPWCSDDCCFFVDEDGNVGLVFGFNPALFQIVTAPCGNTPATGPITSTAGGVGIGTSYASISGSSAVDGRSYVAAAVPLTFDVADMGYTPANSRRLFGWSPGIGTNPPGLYGFDLLGPSDCGAGKTCSWTSTPGTYVFGAVLLLNAKSITGFTVSSGGSVANASANKYFQWTHDAGLAKDDNTDCLSLGWQVDDLRYILCWRGNGTLSTTNGRWWDLETDTMGGAWGNSTSNSTNWASIPAPVSAPTVTSANVTGGTAVAGDTFNVCQTYTVTWGGETACGPAGTFTLAAGNNALAFSRPAAPTLSGQAPSWDYPSGWNNYACDTTASPGCSPKLQADITMPQPALAYTSCAGSGSTSSSAVSFNFYAIATNGNSGSKADTLRSVPSPVVTHAGCGTGTTTTNPGITVTATVSGTAETFVDFELDDPGQVQNSGSGGSQNVTVAGGTASYPFNGGQLRSYTGQTAGFNISTVNVGTILTTTQSAPSNPSTAGWIAHNVKMGNSNWAKITNGQFMLGCTVHLYGMPACSQGSMEYQLQVGLWYLGDTAASTVFTCGVNAIPTGDLKNTGGTFGTIGYLCGSHQVMGNNSFVGLAGYSGCNSGWSWSADFMPMQSTGAANYASDVAAITGGSKFASLTPTGCNAIPAGYPGYDQHPSFANAAANINDKALVTSGLYIGDNTTTTGAHAFDSTVISVTPWNGDMLGVWTGNLGTGTAADARALYRFGHSWTAGVTHCTAPCASPSSAVSFFAKTGMQESISGKYALYTSTMLQGSGITQGSASVVPTGYGVGCSGPVGTNAHLGVSYCSPQDATYTIPRYDVFLVELK